MNMTQLQRDAMALAKAGDWALADAMELAHRADNDEDVVCGLLVDGRMRGIAYGDQNILDGINTSGVCEECEGGGKVECGECGHFTDCEDCDGTGYVVNDGDLDAIEDVDDLTCRTLDGDPFDIDNAGRWLSVGSARRLLEEYHRKTGRFAPKAEPAPTTHQELPACA